MSDSREQIERVLDESGVPADVTAEEPLEPDIHPDRTRETVSSGFSRMPMDWNQDDREQLAIIEATAEQVIKSEFRVAFAVREKLRRCVRNPLTDKDTGEIKTYPDGTPMWELDEFEIPVEDWSLLDDTTRSDMLHSITVYMGEWEMISVSKWARAMFSKVQWEQVFARGYTALPGVSISGKPTIEDRTQWGQRIAVEPRYFAVFQSAISKHAERQVASMEKLRWLLAKTIDS